MLAATIRNTFNVSPPSVEPAVLDNLAGLRDDEPDEEDAQGSADGGRLERASVIGDGIIGERRGGGQDGSRRGRAKEDRRVRGRGGGRGRDKGAADRGEEHHTGDEHGSREHDRAGRGGHGGEEGGRR